MNRYKDGDFVRCFKTDELSGVTEGMVYEILGASSYDGEMVYSVKGFDGITRYSIDRFAKIDYGKVEPEQSPKTFQSVLEEMKDTFIRKNNDYGNSFDKTYDEFGDIAPLVRMCDKIERLKSLIAGNPQLVKDEAMKDTIIDIANYAVMWYVRK